MTSLARHWLRVAIRAPLVSLVTMACGGGTEPLVHAAGDAAVTLEAVTPTSLTATVATAVLPSPAVRVRDKEGRPKVGVGVQFDFTYWPATASTLAVTDADGVASNPYVLGYAAGTGSVTAHVGSANVVFSLTGVAGPIAKIESIDTGRLGLAGGRAGPLRARIIDAYNNGIAGTVVGFAVSQGGGSLESDTATTDAYGFATSGQWRLGDAGTNRAVARVGTLVGSAYEANALLPGRAGIDALYTLATIDDHAAAERKWNGSITLTSDGHWSARSIWDCCTGSVQTFQGTGRYAIVESTIVLSIESGNWLEWPNGPAIWEIPLLGSTTGATLEFTWFVDGPDNYTTWAYQRTP